MNRNRFPIFSPVYRPRFWENELSEPSTEHGGLKTLGQPHFGRSAKNGVDIDLEVRCYGSTENPLVVYILEIFLSDIQWFSVQVSRLENVRFSWISGKFLAGTGKFLAGNRESCDGFRTFMRLYRCTKTTPFSSIKKEEWAYTRDLFPREPQFALSPTRRHQCPFPVQQSFTAQVLLLIQQNVQILRER